MVHALRYVPLPFRLFQKRACVVLFLLPLVALGLIFFYHPLQSFNSLTPIKTELMENVVVNAKENQIEAAVAEDKVEAAAIEDKLVATEKVDKAVTVTERPHKESYTIHVWKHGKRMKNRFLRSYGATERDPYKFCSVRNCILTINDTLVNESDAVLFHLHQTKGPHTLPSYHPKHQIWIFFTDESPYHTFLATRKYKMKDYNGIFNWSMTYRSDSDIPAPYGRTVPLSEEEAQDVKIKNYAKLKTKGVAILGSNCGGRNYRWEYVRELKKYINVDMYGGCGHLKCPGHFNKDCSLIDDYKFYLAFENSNCKEYVTEKMWWNAFEKESVPIVMGASKEDYARLCPPNSFIHVYDYNSPKELANYIEYLMKNETAYNAYFEWKKWYKVLNEHGYFGSTSMHLCNICTALNRQSPLPKIYNDLHSFWDVESDCYPVKWTPFKK